MDDTPCLLVEFCSRSVFRSPVTMICFTPQRSSTAADHRSSLQLQDEKKLCPVKPTSGIVGGTYVIISNNAQYCMLPELLRRIVAVRRRGVTLERMPLTSQSARGNRMNMISLSR